MTKSSIFLSAVLIAFAFVALPQKQAHAERVAPWDVHGYCLGEAAGFQQMFGMGGTAVYQGCLKSFGAK